jgi:hypothetical protein
MTSLCQTTLFALQGTGGVILSEFKVELPEEDIDGLNQATAQFQDFSATIQGHIYFFNQYSDPPLSGVRAVINVRMGNTSSGLNKHLTHWAAEAVKKPDGPYAVILGGGNHAGNGRNEHSEKRRNLNFFGQDKDFRMEPAAVQAIYNRAVMNPDQSIKRFETDIMWNLIQAANKYKALSMPFSEIPLPLSNKTWDESSGAWVVNKLESGFLNNTLTIAPPTESTVFRIMSFDTDEGDAGDFQRTDSFNTKSKQTDIISEDLSFTQEAEAPGPDGVMRRVVSFDGATAKQIKERDFLWLNESEIAQIIGVSDSNYMLDIDYGTIASLRKLTGLYYVSSIEPPDEEFGAEKSFVLFLPLPSRAGIKK